MGIFDFAQSASNAAASNITGPVDLLTLLLQKAGLPVPDNAVGGSKWMEQKGLLKPVPQSASSLAGETMGLIGPMVAAAKAPEIARGLLKMGENAAAPRTLNPQLGAIVYHGSPHKFDKFDSSKIGTGEGAQAYGHGLYLAESPDVARTYSADRAYVGAAMSGKPAAINYDDPVWIAQKTIDELGSPAKAKAHLEMVSRTAANHMSKESADAVSKAIDLVASGEVAAKGSLYKVDLPDTAIARMLDWDKPLSQQAPEVRAAMEKYRLPPYATGQQVVDMMQNRAMSAREPWDRGPLQSYAKDASSGLRQAGIPGIRYLDGGSRGAGTGTSNYVVFPGEEGLLKILERNGMAP